MEPDRLLFDFRSAARPWSSIDDVVMGGRSSSVMRGVGGAARFVGVVSLENGGGFASVRSDPAAHDLAGFRGVAVRARGDGKRYGLRLRTTAAFDGVSYEAMLDLPAGEWSEARLPFTQFLPVYRGRRLADHPALDPAAIRTFGLIISDKQAGPFRLELEWIGAYR